MGRWITHVCVWIETLSFDIRDSMCGLRVYPLAAVAALIDGGAGIGERMDFDTEILVRLHRAGTPVVNHPVRVAYPPGNLSNFRMWRDNWRITSMHTRLLIGTLFTWPALLWQRRRRAAPATHWAGLAERGLYWGLQISAWPIGCSGVAAAWRFSRRSCSTSTSPPASGGARRSTSSPAPSPPAADRRPAGGTATGISCRSPVARSTASSPGWAGCPPTPWCRPRSSALDEANAQTRGAVFIVSHHGNVDISRALLDAETRRRVVVLMHTRHAENYNRILREFNPDAAVNTFQVTEMGPDTAIALQERVEHGDWLFIAGDRTPVGGGHRISVAPFLGADAEFSQGPYLMAALLDCPVYLFFCRRESERYGLRVERLAERIVLPRGQRDEALAATPRPTPPGSRSMCWKTRSSGTTFTISGDRPAQQHRP